jgi:hypothetical protein
MLRGLFTVESFEISITVVHSNCLTGFRSLIREISSFFSSCRAFITSLPFVEARTLKGTRKKRLWGLCTTTWMNNRVAFSGGCLSLSELIGGECCVSCRATKPPSTSFLVEGEGEAAVAIVDCC